jgi:hypothetical protein
MQTLTTPIHPPRSVLLSPAKPSSKARCIVGATLGLIFFLLVGLLPSVLVGGSAGIQVANLLGGAHLAPAYGLRALASLGMVSTVVIGAGTFAALGAALGAAIGELSTDRVAPPPAH